MVSPIAPTIETQVAIEQPISAPSTSLGSLFSDFLRSTTPKAPSASSVNLEAGSAYVSAYHQRQERLKVIRSRRRGL